MFTQARFHSNIRHLTNHFISRILPIVACTLLAGLILRPTATVQAQSNVEPTVSETLDEMSKAAPSDALGITSIRWRAAFGEQTAEVLRQQGASAEQAVMRDVIAVAKTGERGIDLSDAVAPLLQVAQDGSSEERRIMALQALESIGPEHSSELLYGQAIGQLRSGLQDESSERVRHVTRAVINGFYAENSK